MPQQLSKLEIEEIEAAVDAAFLKLHGKTYRHAATTPSEKNGHHPDSLARIESDFSDVFGPTDEP